MISSGSIVTIHKYFPVFSNTKKRGPQLIALFGVYYSFTSKFVQRAMHKSNHHSLITPHWQSDFCPHYFTETPFPKVTSVFQIAKSNIVLSVLIPEITVALNIYLTSLTLAHFLSFFFCFLRELVILVASILSSRDGRKELWYQVDINSNHSKSIWFFCLWTMWSWILRLIYCNLSFYILEVRIIILLFFSWNK